MESSPGNAFAERPGSLECGDPIVIWQDGKVVKISVAQIEISEPMAEYRVFDEKDK